MKTHNDMALKEWAIVCQALEEGKQTLLLRKEGVVEELPKTMEDAKLQAAVDILVAKYPPEVVAVYLNAFNDMNTAGWANLKAMLESDSRLQLGAA